MSQTQAEASTQTNPHCPLHPLFTAACEQCCRARAAFQPYQIHGKAGPPTRSVQQGESLIITQPGLSAPDLATVVAADVVAESFVDRVLPFFET